MSRILAIEPDADRAVLLEQLVRENLDTDLVLAASTEAAIATMAESRPDLILTSMLLPANEEQHLVAHLRAIPSLRRIPVLTIPAVSNPSTTEARPTGFFARFRRRRQRAAWPTYNFNAVITRIEEALEQSRVAAARTEHSGEDAALVPIVEPPPVERFVESREEPPVLGRSVDEPGLVVLDSRAGSRGLRKRARRLPVSDVPWLSAVKLSWGQELRLLNISSSGMLVESGVRLSPGDTAKIELDGPGLALAVPARVVRCRVSQVDSLGVKYQTAAMFERPVEELLPPEEEPGDAREQLDSLVAEIKARAASGAPQAELRGMFESGVLDLVTAREVRLREVPIVENDGCESIYFTVPTADGSRAVLQVTFNPDDAPTLDEFDVLTAAARAAATVLPLTGIWRQAAIPPDIPALRLVGRRANRELELQIA